MSLFRKSSVSGFLQETTGASALEFVLIVPALILLTLGTINLSLMVYTVAALHFASEDAARCATVKKSVCASQATLQTYAAARYGGLTATPTFTWTTPACGNFVRAAATYTFITGFTSTPIQLTADACYPLS